ncbi:MAG: DUF4097 family beta strand repeat-containing protein [Candidatus Coproplasma sp.]
MKYKIFKLEATAEINEICCNIYDAALNINVYDGKELKVTLPDCKNVNVAVGEKSLIINQAKRLFNFKKQVIGIEIPEHVLPSLSITGNRALISIDGGIYADLSINGVCGELKTANSSFAFVQVTSSDLNVNLSDTTVKHNLFMQIVSGQLIAENSFASIADCHLKNGNMGLINLSVGNCTFETDNGNITMTLAGCEDEYNTLIRVKNGTSNRPSTQIEGAQNSVNAYTDNGNVLIDFLGEKVVICEAAVSSDDLHNENDAVSAEERTL